MDVQDVPSWEEAAGTRCHREFKGTEPGLNAGDPGLLPESTYEDPSSLMTTLKSDSVFHGVENCPTPLSLPRRWRLGTMDGFTIIEPSSTSEGGNCSTLSSGTSSPHSTCGSQQWEAVGSSPRSTDSFSPVEPSGGEDGQDVDRTSATLRDWDDDYDMISDAGEGVLTMSACSTPQGSPPTRAAVSPKRPAVPKPETPCDIVPKKACTEILAGDKSFGSGPSTVIPLSPTPGALELLPGHVSAPPADSIRPRFTTETLQGIHGVTSGPALGSGQDLAPAQIEISVDMPAQGLSMEGQPFLAAPLNLLTSQPAATTTGINDSVPPAPRTSMHNSGVQPPPAVIPVRSPSPSNGATGNSQARRQRPPTPAGSTAVGGGPLSAMQPCALPAVNRKRDAARHLRGDFGSTAAALPSGGSPRVPSSYAAVTVGSTGHIVGAPRPRTSSVNAVNDTSTRGRARPPCTRNAADGGPPAIDMSPLPTGLDCALSRARATRTVAADGEAHHLVGGAASRQMDEAGKVQHTAASVRELILRRVSPSLQTDTKSRAAAFLNKALGLKPGQLERTLGLEGHRRPSRRVVAEDLTKVIDAFNSGWHGPVVPGIVGG